MKKAEEAVRFISVLMCEDLRQEVTGLQSLIGVFPRHMESPVTTLQVPKLVFRIEFESEEEFTGQCSFVCTSPSDVQVFANPSPMQMGIKKGVANICAVGWGPAVFTEPGIHQLKFSINDKYSTILEFKVVLAGNDGTNQAVGGTPSP